MLELKNIHKVFNPGTINEKRAIQNLSFTLNDGDFVTVIGGNGAGKSTMLNLIAGVYTADAGSIVLARTLPNCRSTNAPNFWAVCFRTR